MENLLEIFFSSKVPEFSHVAFKLMEKHCSVFFFRWFVLRFREKTYAKNQVFLGGVSLRSFVRMGNKRNLLFQSNEAWLFAACKSLRCYNEVIEIHFDYISFFGGQRD